MPKLNLHDPKTQAIAAVGVGVVAYALYKRHQAAGGGTTASTSDPTGAAAALGDANLQDAVYQPLESQIQDLAATVAQLQNTPPPAPSSPAPTSPVAQPPFIKKKPLTTPKPKVHIAAAKPAAPKKPAAKKAKAIPIGQRAGAAFLPGY